MSPALSTVIVIVCIAAAVLLLAAMVARCVVQARAHDERSEKRARLVDRLADVDRPTLREIVDGDGEDR